MNPRRPFEDQAHDEHHGGDEGWLISYADLMTLLFGFFVILYSMSKVDQKKMDAMVESIEKQFRAVSPVVVNPTAQFSKALKEQLVKAGLDSRDVEMVDDGQSLTISLRGRASFETGRTDLLPAGEAFVKDVAFSLKGSTLPYEVRVDGHTDDAPAFGKTFASNWELSAARAAGVARRMADYGVPIEKLVASGYGSSRPLRPNRTAENITIPENMALNRRIAITVVFPKAKPAPATGGSVVATGVSLGAAAAIPAGSGAEPSPSVIKK